MTKGLLSSITDETFVFFLACLSMKIRLLLFRFVFPFLHAHAFFFFGVNKSTIVLFNLTHPYANLFDANVTVHSIFVAL